MNIFEYYKTAKEKHYEKKLNTPSIYIGIVYMSQENVGQKLFSLLKIIT